MEDLGKILVFTNTDTLYKYRSHIVLERCLFCMSDVYLEVLPIILGKLIDMVQWELHIILLSP